MTLDYYLVTHAIIDKWVGNKEKDTYDYFKVTFVNHGKSMEVNGVK